MDDPVDGLRRLRHNLPSGLRAVVDRRLLYLFGDGFRCPDRLAVDGGEYLRLLRRQIAFQEREANAIARY